MCLAAVPRPDLKNGRASHTTRGGKNMNIIDKIRAMHRQRRFALKNVQGAQRRLESLVRRAATDWHPKMNEKERAQIKTRVQSVIKAARANETHELHDA